MNPKISELLTKINSLLEAQAIASLSTLEFDLLQHHIRELYVLTGDQQTQSSQSTVVSERVKETTYEPIVTKSMVQASSVQQMIEPEIIEPIIVNQTPIITPSEVTITAQKVEETRSVETIVTTKSSALNEVTKTSVSLNEKWVNTSVEMHKKLASKSLRELIDFNKRFAIVNELFSGDTVAFQQAVNALDEAANYEQAETIYTELAQSQAWDTASQTTRLFGKLIKQRFGLE